VTVPPTAIEKLVKLGHVVFEICALTERQTDKQTDRQKLEDGLRRHSIDVDAFADSTACDDLDLLPLSSRI